MCCLLGLCVLVVVLVVHIWVWVVYLGVSVWLYVVVYGRAVHLDSCFAGCVCIKVLLADASVVSLHVYAVLVV